MANKYIQAKDGNDNAYFRSKMELIWSNPAPQNQFAPQTISIPGLAKYEKFLCVFKRITTQQGVEVTVLTRKTVYVSVIGMPAYKIAVRDFELTNNQAIFTDATLISSLGSGSTDNNYLIPYQIYGLD